MRCSLIVCRLAGLVLRDQLLPAWGAEAGPVSRISLRISLRIKRTKRALLGKLTRRNGCFQRKFAFKRRRNLVLGLASHASGFPLVQGKLYATIYQRDAVRLKALLLSRRVWV